MLDRPTLATYLHYGYVPRDVPASLEQPWIRLRAPAGGTTIAREELLSRGVGAFRSACRESLAEGPGGRHVIPLSGGIDSRFLLATLVDLGLGDRIATVTFGVPGTWDFDLGAQVARAAGVPHTAIDLSQHPITRAGLLATARAAPWTFLFEVAYNHLVFERFGPAATYWSGSLANLVAGQDAAADFPDWPSACRRFAVQSRFQRAIDLTPPGFSPVAVLPARPLVEGSWLNPFEQLYGLLRNSSRNDPALLPAGYDVRTPFLRSEWVGFMLRVPKRIRHGGRFYHELASLSAPELFALPAKNYLGHPVHAPRWRVQLRRARLKLARTLKGRFPGLPHARNPKLNYVDFDQELRGRTPLSGLVEESLEHLRRSGAVDWLDPLELWTRHVHRRANLGEALALLASLELNLAAGANEAGAPCRSTLRAPARGPARSSARTPAGPVPTTSRRPGWRPPRR